MQQWTPLELKRVSRNPERVIRGPPAVDLKPQASPMGKRLHTWSFHRKKGGKLCSQSKPGRPDHRQGPLEFSFSGQTRSIQPLGSQNRGSWCCAITCPSFSNLGSWSSGFLWHFLSWIPSFGSNCHTPDWFHRRAFATSQQV